MCERLSSSSSSLFSSSIHPAQIILTPSSVTHTENARPRPRSVHEDAGSDLDLPNSAGQRSVGSRGGPPLPRLASARTPRLLKRIKTRTGLDQHTPDIWDLVVMPKGQNDEWMREGGWDGGRKTDRWVDDGWMERGGRE
jgi:hypothetical protein